MNDDKTDNEEQKRFLNKRGILKMNAFLLAGRPR